MGFSVGCSRPSTACGVVNCLIYSYILLLTKLRCESREVCRVKAVVKDLPIISCIVAKHSLAYPFLLILQDKGKICSLLNSGVVKRVPFLLKQ